MSKKSTIWREDLGICRKANLQTVLQELIGALFSYSLTVDYMVVASKHPPFEKRVAHTSSYVIVKIDQVT